jgi:hypothetical protein
MYVLLDLVLVCKPLLSFRIRSLNFVHVYVNYRECGLRDDWETKHHSVRSHSFSRLSNFLSIPRIVASLLASIPHQPLQRDPSPLWNLHTIPCLRVDKNMSKHSPSSWFLPYSLQLHTHFPSFSKTAPPTGPIRSNVECGKESDGVIDGGTT